MGRLGRALRRLSPRTADAIGIAYNEIVHLRYRNRPIAEVFSDIHERNHWRSAESRSGPGSTVEQTARIRDWLPLVLLQIQAESMLDIPCGDFSWLSATALPIKRYIGADIVGELISKNRSIHSAGSREFLVLDVTRSELPRVDVVFTRDCLVHLSFADGLRALRNIKQSGSRWLLTTTFLRHENRDITTGNWRPINLSLRPYSLPDPVLILMEGCTEGEGRYRDKALALYRLEDIPTP